MSREAWKEAHGSKASWRAGGTRALEFDRQDGVAREYIGIIGWRGRLQRWWLFQCLSKRR
jgi:hypothetical protein